MTVGRVIQTENRKDMVTSYDQEWSALRQALRAIPPDPQTLDPIRWRSLLKCHRLEAWFFTQIAKKHWNPEAPLYQTLKADFEKHQQRILLLLAERVMITKAFEQLDIRCLHFKGSVLSQYIYGNPAVRTSVDIDMLISPDQFRAANQCLLAKGYVRSAPSEQVIEEDLERYQWVKKDAIYWHPEKKITLELHWRLTTSPYWINDPFENLWNERTPVVFQGCVLNALNSEFHFLYLCLHAARSWYTRLQWLVDLSAFTQQVALDEARLMALAKQYQLQNVSEISIALLHLFQMPVRITFPVSRRNFKFAQAIFRHLNQFPEQNRERGEWLPLRVRLMFVLRIHPPKTVFQSLHLAFMTYTSNRSRNKRWSFKHPILNYGVLVWYLLTFRKPLK
jgi:hypothetical protein